MKQVTNTLPIHLVGCPNFQPQHRAALVLMLKDDGKGEGRWEFPLPAAATRGGVGYPLYDLTASGLTHTAGVKFEEWPNRHRIGTLDWTTSLGVIEFEWNRKDPFSDCNSATTTAIFVYRTKCRSANFNPRN